MIQQFERNSLDYAIHRDVLCMLYIPVADEQLSFIIHLIIFDTLIKTSMFAFDISVCLSTLFQLNKFSPLINLK